MKTSKYSILIFAVMQLFFSACQKQVSTANYDVVPLPQQVEAKEGDPFTLNKSTKIVYPQGDEDLKRVATFLSSYLKSATDLDIAITDKEQTENAILLKTGFSNENTEAYNLSVNSTQIIIAGASPAGVFYGIQTLRKSIDADANGKTMLFPAVSITDYPRFGYRGMMLDVARHFSSVEFVKTYIDLLALHNLNTFHWHLTDDQGWRIEIKKYPKLAELGSQRKETLVGRNTTKFDGKPYGEGLYYTQEQIKDIVAYAQERFITVIPEIDIPGHMLGALTAYPELGCTGGPYEVATKWGVFDDVVCLGNDASMLFLEDVFREIIPLFPSKYIHIGGDECPKERWKVCPKCQAKIKALGLKADDKHSAEDRLQSYCMSTIEKFLNDNGKQIIGWDEILEGGLAPNATVMSWRGEEGGIVAAKQGHDVIMAPSTYLYFDYYQTRDVDAENVQLGIGNYIPLERVYSYEPLPPALTPEESKHILGVQANLWAECLPSSKNIEYMLLPRLDALSEVQWTMPEKKNYDSFLKRMTRMFNYYDKQGYNYSKTIFEVAADLKADAEKKVIDVKLATFDNAPIHYTLDETTPTARSEKYTGAFTINKTTTLKAIAIRETSQSTVLVRNFNFSKSTFMPISVSSKSLALYNIQSTEVALVDGISGNGLGFGDGSWVGFSDTKPLEFVVNLEKKQSISSVKIGTYIRLAESLLGATKLTVFISNDGAKYTQVASEDYAETTANQRNGAIEHLLKFDAVEALYLKIEVDKPQQIPTWHRHAGKVPSLYLDEIQVN